MPRTSVLLVLACAASVACVLEDPLGPESPPVDSPLLGRWRVESQLDSYRSTLNLFDGTMEAYLVGHCDLVADLTVSEVRPSGALTWSLRTSSACSPSDTTFEAERNYSDTWERTAWGQLQGDRVTFTTPWPKTRNGVTDHTCQFTGTLVVVGQDRTMQGTVWCQYLLDFYANRYPWWTGVWAATLMGPAPPS